MLPLKKNPNLSTIKKQWNNLNKNEKIIFAHMWASPNTFKKRVKKNNYSIYTFFNSMSKKYGIKTNIKNSSLGLGISLPSWRDITGHDVYGNVKKKIKDVPGDIKGGIEWTIKKPIELIFFAAGVFSDEAQEQIEEALTPDFYANLDKPTKDILVYGVGGLLLAGVLVYAYNKYEEKEQIV